MLTSPKVTVIIPALNEERCIADCLASLTRIEYPRDLCEVLVIDNGSRDRTAEIARSFSGILNLAVYSKPGVRVSALRNFGARLATGDRLLFLDADCVVPPDWIERSVAASEAGLPEPAVFGARFRLPANASWIARCWWEHDQRHNGTSPSYLSSHNLHTSRDAFLAVGGFDECLETNEDFEICQRFRAAGGSVIENPTLSVVHLGNADTLTSFFRRERWHGRDVFRVFLRNIRKRHNLRAVAFAVYMLTALAMLAAGFATAALGGSWLLLGWAALATVVAPVALGVRTAVILRKPRLATPLSLLMFIYGVARAAALLDCRRLSQRKLFKVATS